MSSSKILTCLRPRTPYPPRTLYTCIQYTYSHREGREGWRAEPREKVRRATVHKAGSINSDKHPVRKVSLQVIFFRLRHFALVSVYLISPRVPRSVYLSVPVITKHTVLFVQRSSNFQCWNFRTIYGGLGTESE